MGGGACEEEEHWDGEGRGGVVLRYQVFLALLALDVLGLGTGHVHVSGVGSVLQQVMEGIQVVRLREGGKEQREGGRTGWRDEKEKGRREKERVG